MENNSWHYSLKKYGAGKARLYALSLQGWMEAISALKQATVYAVSQKGMQHSTVLPYEVLHKGCITIWQGPKGK